jgi:serralysin
VTTFIISSNFPIDTRSFNLSSLMYASNSIANSGLVRASFSSSQYIDFFGSYKYDTKGNFTGGVVNRIVEIYGDQVAYEINNFSLNAVVFANWVVNGSSETAKRVLFSGNDVIIGSDFGDYVEYYGGSDLFNGRGGTDTIILSRAGSYTSNQLASVREGDAWRVIMPDGEIALQSVERIQVNSYTTVTPESLSFDGLAYLAVNTDVLSAVGVDSSAAARHYVRNGRREGRATSGFDAMRYLAANADLGAAFGADTGAALTHYLHYGHGEGRSTFFDAARYMASNPDLIAAFGANLTAGIQHYIQHGRREGRSTTSFDPASYLAANVDVSRAGYTVANAASHFLTNGWREGRRLTAPAQTSMEFGLSIGG